MKKRWIAPAIALGILLGAVGSMLAAPGDADDPVITLSYVENVLKPLFQKEIKEAAAPVFAVVEFSRGQTLLCKAGGELILRRGVASVVATQKGGLANVTAGADLPDGAPMPSNSLLIVPVDDGRGVKAEDDAVILMVKGPYEIIDEAL